MSTDAPRQLPDRHTDVSSFGRIAGLASRVFDRIEARWESASAQRSIGTLLVTVFIAALTVIELNRQGLLPGPVSSRLTTNHFGAVGVAFALLLAIEVVGLVFALAHSVANSVGKQFEILSLILLRKAFLEFAKFGEPVEWARVAGTVPVILADLGGALLVFLLVGLFYRMQRHRPITRGERELAGFVRAKKLVALGLLVAFAGLGARQLVRALDGAAAHDFFEQFYTVLILSDVLIVLVSLRYTSDYWVIFRNSGFAAATVLIRLALTAPPYVNAALGVAAAALALGLSLVYNGFTPREPAPGKTPPADRHAPA